MSANKGFKEFGERAIAAMMKELTQLVKGAYPGKPVVVQIDPDKLTQQMKREALDAVNIIQEKKMVP